MDNILYEKRGNWGAVCETVAMWNSQWDMEHGERVVTLRAASGTGGLESNL